MCFDAQQCAEKAVKAVFVSRREPFPYVHDLKQLLTLLEKNGVKIHKYVWQAEELSPFAIVTRYPDRVAPVSGRKYRHAIRIATRVLRWAERQVGPP